MNTYRDDREGLKHRQASLMQAAACTSRDDSGSIGGQRAGTGACPYNDGLSPGRRGRPKPALPVLSEAKEAKPKGAVPKSSTI